MIFRVCLILLVVASAGWADEICGHHSAENIETIELHPLKFSCSDSWMSRDKAHHFLLSGFLAAGSYYILHEENAMTSGEAMTFSVGFSLSLGVAKEVRDSVLQGRIFSEKDLIADVLGVLCGALIFNAN
ncbi:MAG: VanZ family protein [candidate division KSB1 bacterium]|jgi:uncharacterized protein YfiM (DUF2279 family)|nr:VanZ family protein [candidate division KSB1 bacterium]